MPRKFPTGKPRIVGNAGCILQSRTTRFDPDNGETVTREWAGPGVRDTGVSGYATVLRNMGIAFELTETGVVSTLSEIKASDSVVTGSDDAIVTERFDILYNEQVLDIKESPLWIGLDPEQSVQVLKDVERYQQGKSGDASGDWDDTGVWGGDALTAISYYNIMIQGVTTYPVDSWVLRHTYNIPGDTTQGRSGHYPGAIDSGIGSIYATASLLALISTQHVRIREKISGISLPAKTGYYVGWKKKPTGESAAGNNRVEVTAEYLYAQWPAIINELA
jgi:hypothetical protein